MIKLPFISKPRLTADKLAKLVQAQLAKQGVPALTVQAKDGKVNCYTAGVLAIDFVLTPKGWSVNSSLDLKMHVTVNLVAALAAKGVRIMYGEPFVLTEDGVALDGPDAELYVMARSANEFSAIYPQKEPN